MKGVTPVSEPLEYIYPVSLFGARDFSPGSEAVKQVYSRIRLSVKNIATRRLAVLRVVGGAGPYRVHKYCVQ